MSDSVRPHRWQPTRLRCHWDSPGKNTGVGCHFLLQCMKMKSDSEVTQLCLTLSDPMDCSLPGSSVHGIFQARVLEWGAIAFSTSLSYKLPNPQKGSLLQTLFSRRHDRLLLSKNGYFSFFCLTSRPFPLLPPSEAEALVVTHPGSREEGVLRTQVIHAGCLLSPAALPLHILQEPRMSLRCFSCNAISREGPA